MKENFKYIRVAAISPSVVVANIAKNTEQIIEQIRLAKKNDCQVALFPELAVPSYSCADLFYQKKLQSDCIEALFAIAETTKKLEIIAIVGLPIAHCGHLFNCAVFIANGKIKGIVPKTYLPNTNEFYESRWFTSADKLTDKEISLKGQTIPFGIDLIFTAENEPNCAIGIEICEDLWAVIPPSSNQALAGANLLFNLSSSNELLGKSNYRRELISQQSARCLAGYIYASSNSGESTTDTVYSSHCLIAEDGVILAENKERLTKDLNKSQMLIADIDYEKLQFERLQNTSFAQQKPSQNFIKIAFQLPDFNSQKLHRKIDKLPFVPDNIDLRAKHCQEIFAIQATALAKRLAHINCKKVMIGISGGLDSTLALLVAIESFNIIKLPLKNIQCITMPGPGTSKRTLENAKQLAQFLQTSFETISINKAIKQHFKDIKQNPELHDITFENSQARERTQILMDKGNQLQALVLGTGDLSELALGWCTYNADHMSMYHINAGVPKTLVKYIVEWCAQEKFSGPAKKILTDIINTPISPELLPLDSKGKIQQKTEEVIGPYELHDFFLFNMVRNGFPPKKILALAEIAFAINDKKFSKEEIKKWLKVFIKRFFANQFKRSAMPDSVKVGSVALSPRADWRMPSDAEPHNWLNF